MFRFINGRGPDKIGNTTAGYSLPCDLCMELAYAITIHKSMGSEYETVIIPILMAHRILLTKNLIYTAVTRAKKRVILVGQKRALFLAIHSGRKVKRNTCLAERILKYNQVFRQKPLPQGATEQKLKKAG